MPEKPEVQEINPSEVEKAIWTTPHTTDIDMNRTLNAPGSGADGVIVETGGIP